MGDKVYELLKKLPKDNLINLMWQALDTMQAYNGRSRTYCILDGIGAVDNDDGKWKIPSLKEIKANTETSL